MVSLCLIVSSHPVLKTWLLVNIWQMLHWLIGVSYSVVGRYLQHMGTVKRVVEDCWTLPKFNMSIRKISEMCTGLRYLLSHTQLAFKEKMLIGLWMWGGFFPDSDMTVSSC